MIVYKKFSHADIENRINPAFGLLSISCSFRMLYPPKVLFAEQYSFQPLLLYAQKKKKKKGKKKKIIKKRKQAGCGNKLSIVSVLYRNLISPVKSYILHSFANLVFL